MDVVKLKGRLAALKPSHDSNPEDLALELQDKFAEYARLKLGPLTRKVAELLPRPAKVEEPVDEPVVKKTRKMAFAAPRPSERLEDVCGLDPALTSLLRDLVVLPLRYPDVYSRLLGGAAACAGLLLCGAPGTGKTLIARALAGETGASFFALNATEVVAGVSGEAEGRLRELFEAAKNSAPSLVLLDDVDAICPSGRARELERRMVSQLTACLDSLETCPGVVVIATTSRPDSLDSSLRRSGRFDREICLGMPDVAGRAKILERLAQTLPTECINIPELARLTAGYVGADLVRLGKEAGMSAAKRAVDSSHAEEESILINQSDFEVALTKVQPSSRREGFSTVPSVSWEDVGALSTLKAELDDTICMPIRRADLFERLAGKQQTSVLGGVLLFGPPGCGKTLLAKAVANASGASFISVKGPELLNKYVGESERAVRQVFSRAATSAPCVIFFDEIDALCPRRNAENTGAQERVVNQMLTEMDGAQGVASGVFVVAATNRPDMVDAAMLRPGRLGKLLYVPLPDQAGRADIIKTLLRHTPHDSTLNVDDLAVQTVRFSGADLNALVREAIAIAVKRIDLAMTDGTELGSVSVRCEDFACALRKIGPSVTEEAERDYLSLQSMQSGIVSN